jgi:predicted Zn-dependent protease
MWPIAFLLSAIALCAQPADLAAKAQRAQELVRADKSDEAIPLYLELVRALPNDAGMLVNLAIAEFKGKRYGDSAAHAGAALALQPDSLAANLFLGSSYVELGENARAIAPLEKVISVQPNDRNARLMLGEASLGLERYDEAAVQFQKASELAPQNPRIWYGLGRSYEALADSAFRRLEQDAPESSYWFALSADVLLKQRRYGSAFAQYRRALNVPDGLRGVHAGLAVVYEQTGHPGWAAVERKREGNFAGHCHPGQFECDFIGGSLRNIVEAAKSNTTPEALYWASNAYSLLAQQAYEHLAQLPPSLERHLQAAQHFESEGLDREAAGEWRETQKLVPGDTRIEISLAESYFRGHNYEAALPLLRELIKKQPNSRESNFLYGASLLNLEQPEKAIEPLETAVRIDPNLLPAQAALGQALVRAARAAEAIPHLKAALSADDDATVHFQLLRAYQLTGQTDLARLALAAYRAFQKSLEEKKKIEERGEITPPG